MFLDVCRRWRVIKCRYLLQLVLPLWQNILLFLFNVYPLFTLSKFSSLLLSLSRFSSFITDWLSIQIAYGRTTMFHSKHICSVEIQDVSLSDKISPRTKHSIRGSSTLLILLSWRTFRHTLTSIQIKCETSLNPLFCNLKRNPHRQNQRSPHCTPERHPPNPPWATRTQAAAMPSAKRSAN
jgi:hypothetical protein